MTRTVEAAWFTWDALVHEIDEEGIPGYTEIVDDDPPDGMMRVGRCVTVSVRVFRHDAVNTPALAAARFAPREGSAR